MSGSPDKSGLLLLDLRMDRERRGTSTPHRAKSICPGPLPCLSGMALLDQNIPRASASRCLICFWQQQQQATAMGSQQARLLTIRCPKALCGLGERHISRGLTGNKPSSVGQQPRMCLNVLEHEESDQDAALQTVSSACLKEGFWRMYEVLVTGISRLLALRAKVGGSPVSHIQELMGPSRQLNTCSKPSGYTVCHLDRTRAASQLQGREWLSGLAARDVECVNAHRIELRCILQMLGCVRYQWSHPCQQLPSLSIYY